jgi:hypothetical protein
MRLIYVQFFVWFALSTASVCALHVVFMVNSQDSIELFGPMWTYIVLISLTALFAFFAVKAQSRGLRFKDMLEFDGVVFGRAVWLDLMTPLYWVTIIPIFPPFGWILSMTAGGHSFVAGPQMSCALLFTLGVSLHFSFSYCIAQFVSVLAEDKVKRFWCFCCSSLLMSFGVFVGFNIFATA